VIEKSGVLFAYIGEGDPPAFPDFDCFVAPDSHTFAFKGMFECSWLQALEVGIARLMYRSASSAVSLVRRTVRVVVISILLRNREVEIRF
jgi:hypothetical protein